MSFKLCEAKANYIFIYDSLVKRQTNFNFFKMNHYIFSCSLSVPFIIYIECFDVSQIKFVSSHQINNASQGVKMWHGLGMSYKMQ